MVVGTVGGGLPAEVLVAAGVDAVPVTGEPGAPTALADRYIEPMVGERTRSQLQRLLDGTYDLELLLVSREEEAQLRLFYTLRELRRLDPGPAAPRAYLFDVQHTGSAGVLRWNRARVRELCALLGADEQALPAAIRACNAEREARRGAEPPDGARRVYVTGSAHADTSLAELIEASGARLVDGPPLLTDEDGDAIDAIARRLEQPLLARARGASIERAQATAAAARAAGADVALAFYLEGDDGLRWEFPEQRDALAAVGIPTVLLDHQPYDLREVDLDV